ncbi:probable serine/threonine-protein kinase DDB_G0282963, partial [Ceratina calcarata]|uniref:protein-tyrosine-phosphatase n=1 Tax=Ceratina calcarata TaxID=156304 RepID=A0AAJ7S0A7_9HYME
MNRGRRRRSTVALKVWIGVSLILFGTAVAEISVDSSKRFENSQENVPGAPIFDKDETAVNGASITDLEAVERRDKLISSSDSIADRSVDDGRAQREVKVAASHGIGSSLGSSTSNGREDAFQALADHRTSSRSNDGIIAFANSGDIQDLDNRQSGNYEHLANVIASLSKPIYSQPRRPSDADDFTPTGPVESESGNDNEVVVTPSEKRSRLKAESFPAKVTNLKSKVISEDNFSSSRTDEKRLESSTGTFLKEKRDEVEKVERRKSAENRKVETQEFKKRRRRSEGPIKNGEVSDLEKPDDPISLINDTYVNYNTNNKQRSKGKNFDGKTSKDVTDSIFVRELTRGPKEEVEVVNNVTDSVLDRIVESQYQNSTAEDLNELNVESQSQNSTLNRSTVNVTLKALNEFNQGPNVDSPSQNSTSESVNEFDLEPESPNVNSDKTDKNSTVKELDQSYIETKSATSSVKALNLVNKELDGTTNESDDLNLEVTSANKEAGITTQGTVSVEESSQFQGSSSPVPKGRTIAFSAVNEFSDSKVKPTISSLRLEFSSKKEATEIPYPYTKFGQNDFLASSNGSDRNRFTDQTNNNNNNDEVIPLENTIVKGKSDEKFTVTEASDVLENSIQLKAVYHDKNESSTASTASLTKLNYEKDEVDQKSENGNKTDDRLVEKSVQEPTDNLRNVVEKKHDGETNLKSNEKSENVDNVIDKKNEAGLKSKENSKNTPENSGNVIEEKVETATSLKPEDKSGKLEIIEKQDEEEASLKSKEVLEKKSDNIIGNLDEREAALRSKEKSEKSGSNVIKGLTEKESDLKSKEEKLEEPDDEKLNGKSKDNEVPKWSQESVDVTGNGITEVTSIPENSHRKVSVQTTGNPLEPETDGTPSLLIRSALNATEISTEYSLIKGSSPEDSHGETTTSGNSDLETIGNNSINLEPKENITEPEISQSSSNRSNEIPSGSFNPNENPSTTSIEFEFVGLTESTTVLTQNITEEAGSTSESSTLLPTTNDSKNLSKSSETEAVIDNRESSIDSSEDTTISILTTSFATFEFTSQSSNFDQETREEETTSKKDETRGINSATNTWTEENIPVTTTIKIEQTISESKDSIENVTEIPTESTSMININATDTVVPYISKEESSPIENTSKPIEGILTTSPVIPTEKIHEKSSNEQITSLVRIDMADSWYEVCPKIDKLWKTLADILTTGTNKSVTDKQIKLYQDPCQESPSSTPTSSEMPLTSILVYVVDENGRFDSNMTKILATLGENSKVEFPVTETVPDSGNAIAVVVVSSVAFICLVLLAGLLFIMRKRQTRFNYGERCRPVSLDAYSLDSVSAYNSVRRKGVARSSKRSYGNPTFEDSTVIPSHPLNFAGLSSFCNDTNAINEEFGNIPQMTAKIDELPPGAELKNRYANGIPLPETRVMLQKINNDPLTEYINASYVRGPKNATKYYIACQAPMESTVTDFWRLIWEQQCKVIIMLTDLIENGVERCTEYIPPSEVTDCHRLYGDFQVTLKKRETKEKYAISTLHLKNLENNTYREVYHIWYLWPVDGVQSDGAGLIAVLLEARALQRGGPGPIVVHCSPGTGRTGTLIALDLGIRQYEITRTVDVPRVVYTIRRDRAGAVQTK